MGEPSAAAAALAACAPTRDLLRPAHSSGQRLRCALPTVGPPRGAPAGAALDTIADAAWLAASAVLLGAHARVQQITLRLRRRGRCTCVSLDLAPSRSVDELLTQAQHLLQAQAQTQPEIAAASGAGPSGHGVLIDFDHGPAPSADFSVRVAASELDADADLYLPPSLPPLARQLGVLLPLIAAGGAHPIGELSLCDAAERHRVLRGFNTLRLPLPAQTTLASMIGQQLRQQDGAALCAVHGQAGLSWAELDRRSNRLAQRLVACGVGAGHFVALLDRRGLDFVVALVAIWKAGGAYVPVDPGYPAQRVRTMLGDSAAAVAVVGAQALTRFEPVLRTCPELRHVLCQQPVPTEQASAPAPASAATGPGVPAQAPYTLHDAAALAQETETGLPPRCGPRDPAYMLYTSGSTGRPKGAIVRHDGALNHVLAQVQALGHDTVAHFLQSAPASSDISVWQFAAPLALGGTTVVVDDATDVARVLTEIQQHRLQLVELVPTVFKYLIDYAAALPEAERALPSLRYAMVTGESASVALVNAWLALYPQIPIVNAYGPTEAADDISQAVIAAPLPPRQARVGIGRPLANLDLHVLDERLRPLPVGAWGEICVAGVGVGVGYWRQPEKTQDAFVPNPFAALEGAAGPLLYRTGDIGRWRDDGSLECAGRIDHQVKLRGQRIELPEIEAVLREHPGVADAVAQVFHDAAGDGRLLAFVVAAPGVPPCAEDWRRHLADRLPPAMLPAAFVPLAALPLNPAGKVDRQALVAPPPAPAALRPGNPARRGPRNALEAVLLRLWAQELCRPGASGAAPVQDTQDRPGAPGAQGANEAGIGIDDDFFALGGDSLSALAISVAAREAGWRLRSADVLEHPTVARLAAVAQPVAVAVAEAAGAAASPPPDGRGDAEPMALRPLDGATRARFLAAHAQWSEVQALTPAQHGLLLHWLLARDKRSYIDQLCYALDGPLGAPALRAAWQAVLDRHTALRAGFLRSALPQPVQVTARQATLAWREVDLSSLEPAAQAQTWQTLCAQEVQSGFDLARPPLMRLLLARLGPQRHALAWTHHHLLLDGWSLALVLRDVLSAHSQARSAAPAAPAASAPWPADDRAYRAHLARTGLRAGQRFWEHTLSGVPPAPAWPFEAPQHSAPGYGQTELALDPSRTAALAGCAAAHGVTLGTLLQAAWAVVLARHLGGDDIVFGVVSSGRELPVAGIEHMIGLFVVTQPLRVRMDPTQPLGAWLRALQTQAAAARAHEALPLAHAVRAAGLPTGQPLFETLFVLWNFPGLAPDRAAGPGQAPDRPANLSLQPTQYRTVPAYALSLLAVPGPSVRLRLVHDHQRLGDAAVAALRHTLERAVLALAAGQDPRALG